VLHLQHKLDAQGRDLLRASLTRSYRAPDASALLARPSINPNYPKDTENPKSAPDRVGNPALRPELATGLDVVLEKYLPRGGVLSVGLFHKDIRGLFRNVLRYEAVTDWASRPRWVSRPVNLERARSTGLELEFKARADEIGATWLPPELNLRASLTVARSRVQDIPGPDNRLDGQNPWFFNTGFDHRWPGTPWGVGANLAFTPGYAYQQDAAVRRVSARTRTADAYVSFAFDRDTVLRLSVNNLAPHDQFGRNETLEDNGQLLWEETRRQPRANWNIGLNIKL
jgi:iron complex outermembrane receptor protein